MEIYMDVLTFKNTYWNYYVQLENDFFSCTPFCEIDECNDNAFSVKYLQSILSICGEIDTICKRLCSSLDSTFKINKCGIRDYIPILNSNYYSFSQEIVCIKNYNYREIQPWKSIETGKSPDWWKVYNDIKHHRDERIENRENYKKANQKTTVEALCALYILLEYWAALNFATDRKENQNMKMPEFMSKRLFMKNWNFYEWFMGQGPWFNSIRFYKYIDESNK